MSDSPKMNLPEFLEMNLQEEAMLVALIRNGNSWKQANHILTYSRIYNINDDLSFFYQARDLKIAKRMLNF